MNKEITFGSDARTKIKKGIDKAVKCVAPTLGVVGMTALIDFEGLDPIVADDGITILKNLQFKNKYENIGLKMLRKGALRTSIEGGDGTATTTVLTGTLIKKIFEEVKDDSSKIQEVKKRLDNGLKNILIELSKNKKEVTVDDIEQIAIISSLDTEIAKIISDIVKEIGVNGVITIEKSSKLGYNKEIVKGLRFNTGFISPYFINNKEKEESVLENPYIVLVDRKVSTGEQIKSIMDGIIKSESKSILFIADDVDGLALASLIQSSKNVRSINPDGTQTQGILDVCCVKNPYNASRGKDFLFDVASLIGGKVLSEEAGIRLDTSTIEDCGKATKVIVTKDTCTIIGSEKSKELDERVKMIKKKIEETTSDYEKEMLEERLASLTGGIGVIKIGAYTDTEFVSKKLKVENAVKASQSALQEGIIAGGGIALQNIKIEDNLFTEMLNTPFHQMLKNSGMKKYSFAQTTDGQIGINFKTKKIVNMFDTGIVDAYKITRLALESAIAIAKMLLTTETCIVDEDEKK